MEHLSTFTFVGPHCDISRLPLSSIGEASVMFQPCRYVTFTPFLTTSNFLYSMLTYSCHLICVGTPKLVWTSLFTCFIRYVICLLMYCMHSCPFAFLLHGRGAWLYGYYLRKLLSVTYLVGINGNPLQIYPGVDLMNRYQILWLDIGSYKSDNLSFLNPSSNTALTTGPYLFQVHIIVLRTEG